MNQDTWMVQYQLMDGIDADQYWFDDEVEAHGFALELDHLLAPNSDIVVRVNP